MLNYRKITVLKVFSFVDLLLYCNTLTQINEKIYKIYNILDVGFLVCELFCGPAFAKILLKLQSFGIPSNWYLHDYMKIDI